ncbi:MAG: hypothetical protein U9N06_05075 [candidate division WOR-3 bacterium]|nr:hypothetical protein [candidate division WOR-3 bacterium]
MNNKFFYSFITILLATFVMLVGSCNKAQKLKPPLGKEGTEKIKGPGELMNVIEIKAEGEILHYQKESLWGKSGFSEILKSKEEFKSKEINSFEKDLERYKRYIQNSRVEFNETRKSTVLLCDIKGAMYGGDSYEFHWLLGDLPFDLYQFKQFEKELYYKGKINNIPTTIRLVFPYTIAHCHEHVWPG